MSNFSTNTHRNFCLVSVVKLLGIMLRDRCRPTTFHIIRVGGFDGWCLNWPVYEPLIIYFQQSKLQNDNTTCLELHDSKGDTMY